MPIVKRYSLLITLFCTLACTASEGVKKNPSPAEKTIFIGGGFLLEIARPSDHIPGLGLGMKNFFTRKDFFFFASSDFFHQWDHLNNQLDLSAGLGYNFLNQGELSFIGLLGPMLRANFEKNKIKNSVISIHGCLAFALNYWFSKNWIIESAIENKIGFIRRPDVVFYLKLFRRI